MDRCGYVPVGLQRGRTHDTIDHYSSKHRRSAAWVGKLCLYQHRCLTMSALRFMLLFIPSTTSDGAMNPAMTQALMTQCEWIDHAASTLFGMLTIIACTPGPMDVNANRKRVFPQGRAVKTALGVVQ